MIPRLCCIEAMKRYIFAFVIGLGGVALLLSLGLWQVRRLAWKEGIIAGMEARMDAAPIPLADLPAPNPASDLYRPVSVRGRTTGEEVLVLTGRAGQGAAYEVIAVFETDAGRRILLDRGFVPEAARETLRPPVALTVTGHLHWPDEADSFTPPPDAATGLWFVRDVDGMAKTLKTDAILVVTREAAGDDQDIVPVPVDTLNIRNDHLGYAITWFSLAMVWAGMTGFLLWRIRQRTD